MRSLTAVAILVATMLTTGMAQSGSLVITPTTTLATETANNTSGSDTFTTQTNDNPAPSNISKLPVRSLLYAGATTKIYAHFMPWFGGANHMWVGYRSDDRAQVNKQVTDMMTRGYDGAIVDWYGPNASRENNTTLYLRDEAETRGGLFTFAVMEDVGSLNSCATTAGCDVTQKLINDLNYVASTYYSSPAYMRIGGRPVMFFFGVDKYAIDWTRARAGANGNPLFIFRQSSAFTHAQTDGGFSWVGFPSSTSDIGLAYLDDFYSTGLKYPTKQTFGSGYAGFNNTLAAWVSNPPKIVNRFCGQTWMGSLNEAGKYYSASKQLPQMQMVTWNDYEEGSELETGIDSCTAVSAALNGTTLSWTLTGDASVVDHYNVFISADGQNLMKLSAVAATQTAVDLSSLALGTGSYTFYVQAYAKASIRNAMSNGIAYTYTAANQPPVVTLALDRSTGVAPETVTATATASDPDGNVAATSLDFGDGSAPASGLSAAHQYAIPGSYTVTATATDNRGTSTSATATVTITANQPPAAALSLSPGSGTAPVTVTASTANSTDTDGSIASSSIDFGDGTVVTGPSASHSYSSAGTKTVRATVTDNKGASSTTTGTVSVTAPSSVTITSPADASSVSAPVRVAGSGVAGTGVKLTQVYLDGVKQTEVQGASIDTTLSPAPGAHRVVVQCYDNANNVFKAAVNITVQAANQLPVAALSVTPSSGIAPVTVTASTAGSSDPDGTIASSSIDFGDGTVVSGASASHVYSTAGTKTITATVTDNSGATAKTTATVTVTAPNQLPVAALSVTPSSGIAPVTVTASTAGSSDPDGSIASSSIDFGDGTVVSGASASHVYSTAGTKTITATVTDNSGATAKTTATVTVTAPNQLPVAALSVTPSSGIAPVTVTASTTGSSDSDGTIASSSIDFGDGTVVSGTTASHVYSKVGTYTVRATVTDNKGASSTTAKSVAVTAGVNITSPAPGTSATSPVRITASATGAKNITYMRVYVDNVSRYVVLGSAVNTALTMSRGTHTVMVQAGDSGGAVYRASVVITVR